MAKVKITVEVTEEEYEKIKNGILDTDLEKLKKNAIKEVPTQVLINELVTYRINSKQTLIDDAISRTRFFLREGELHSREAGNNYDFVFQLKIYE